MKKIIFILLHILCTASISFGQDIMDKLYDSQNLHLIERTNYFSISNSKNLLADILSCKYFDFRVTKIENLYSFDLKFSIEDSEYSCINKDAKMIFYLSNGETIILYHYDVICPSESFTCDIERNSSLTLHKVDLIYPMDNKSMEKLAKYNIERIKVHMSKKIIDREISQTASSIIHEALNIIK